MNPVFYFDELDKVSDTAKGEEIINLLIHLTDGSQNTKFQDKYYSGIDLDISKSLFIFSFNDITKVNPILLDRLIVIKTKGFEKEDKLNISKKFLIPKILEKLGISHTDFVLDDNVIEHIIEKYTDEKGVRKLQQYLEAIISKIPSARLGNPIDVANAVLFLCSNQSNYINGETLHVNGGMYMA